MVGRNDHVIVDVLQAMDHVMDQANAFLLVNQNQNQNGGAGEFRGLGKFKKNNPHTFKNMYDPDGA